MEIGSAQETVNVSGAVPVLQNREHGCRRREGLPANPSAATNGRAVSQLFNLTPGVEGGGNARVNGLKVGSLEISADGVSTVDRFGGGITVLSRDSDTVQEFRIETVGSDARYSRPANVTLATRSGTNAFHGAVFETHRNNAGGLAA
jgi:hypothetical protein